MRDLCVVRAQNVPEADHYLMVYFGLLANEAWVLSVVRQGNIFSPNSDGSERETLPAIWDAAASLQSPPDTHARGTSGGASGVLYCGGNDVAPIPFAPSATAKERGRSPPTAVLCATPSRCWTRPRPHPRHRRDDVCIAVHAGTLHPVVYCCATAFEPSATSSVASWAEFHVPAATSAARRFRRARPQLGSPSKPASATTPRAPRCTPCVVRTRPNGSMTPAARASKSSARPWRAQPVPHGIIQPSNVPH